MTTIYFIRHAQAQGNKENRFQGIIDLPLTQLGYRQLDALATAVRALPIVHIYTSPLIRAKETALAVNRYLQVPLTVDERLHEVNCGEWENVSFEELERRWPEERRLWREEPWRFTSPGGETMCEVYARVTAAIADIVKAHPNESVAAVCHGGVMRTIFAYTRGGLETPVEQADWVYNTSINRVDIDADGRPRLVSRNDCAHLTKEMYT